MFSILHRRRSAVLLTILLLLLTGSEAIAQSPGPPPVLTLREGLPASADLSAIGVTSVTYGNGLFLACLETPTRLYKSVDGVTWLKIAGPYLGSDTNIVDYEQRPFVTFGAGRFVLTSDSGRIFSSPDLVNWTRSVSGTIANILIVHYIDSTFYALGDTATFLSSRDGINWTTEHTGIGDPTGSYKDIIVGNGHQIIMAVNNEFDSTAKQVQYDKVGGVWAADTLSNFPRLKYAKGRFYQLWLDTLEVSTDFTNWTAASFPDSVGEGLDIFEDSSKVYLVSIKTIPVNNSPADLAYVSSSEDGIHFGDPSFTGVYAERGAYFNHRYFLVGGRTFGPMVGSGDGFHYHILGSDSDYVAFNGTNYVKMSTNEQEVHLYSSTDFTNWIPRDTLPNVVSLLYDSSKFRALGPETWSSVDGVSWSDDGPPPHPFTGMAYGERRYVAWGFDASGAYSLWYSVDGQNWVESTTPIHISTGPKDPPYVIPFGAVLKVRFYNGTIYVVGSAGVILTSADGLTYSLDYAGNSTGHYLTDIVYNPDSARYYIYGSTGVFSAGQLPATAVTNDPLVKNLPFQSDTVNGLPPGMLAWGYAISNILYSNGHFAGLVNDNEDPSYPVNYFIWSRDGLHWDSRKLDRESQISGAVVSGDSFRIEGTNNLELIADFSGTGSPLPVTWLQFTASVTSDATVLLNWQTGMEQNSRGFVIQRNTGGAPAAWDSIGWVPAAGNSAVPLSYTFTDNTPKDGFDDYRLLLVNLDGGSQASEIRRVYIGASVNISVYPNPARDQLAIQATGSTGLSIATLYDANGHVVLQQGFSGNTSLSLERLPAGVYQLTIRLPNGQIYRKEIMHP